MRSTTFLLLTTLLGATIGISTPSVVQAQTLESPRHRQGYYVALGLSLAGNQLWEDGEVLGPWIGSGFSLRLGQLLTRRLGLGLQIESAGSTAEGQKAGVFGLELEGQFALAHNLAMHAGIGLGVVSVQEDKEGASLRGGVGTAYSLGLSYDWFPSKRRLTGGFSIAPTLKARFIPGDSVKAVSGLVGVQFGWWTGLPRNQLELPEADAYKDR